MIRGNTLYYTNCDNRLALSGGIGAHNGFTTKKRAEQFIALGKLLQLRDYWVQHSKLKDAIGVFTCSDGVIVTDVFNTNDCALTFPTQEMADKFITCFRDLIKQAYPLV